MSAMADNGKIICANRDCRIAETGRCVEGLALTACPHYGHEPNNEEVAALRDIAVSDVAGLRLPVADTLPLDEASRLLRKCGGRVIAVIGPKGAGKTSLIASLYDLFQEGPINGIEYARSETLHAFELACHYARSVSRRSEPDMDRTPLGEVKFYHLDVAGGGVGDLLTLLLGDRAGEEYRQAADDLSEATPFREVVRADTVTMLVDGQRLADTGSRHNLRAEIIMTLQALLDGRSLSGQQRLVLVLTKLDVVQASPHKQRVDADFASLHEQVDRVFGRSFDRIESCRVAASPKTVAMARGSGVAELLEIWAAPTARAVAALPALPPSPRAFSRLAVPEMFETDDD